MKVYVELVVNKTSFHRRNDRIKNWYASLIYDLKCNITTVDPFLRDTSLNWKQHMNATKSVIATSHHQRSLAGWLLIKPPSNHRRHIAYKRVSFTRMHFRVLRCPIHSHDLLPLISLFLIHTFCRLLKEVLVLPRRLFLDRYHPSSKIA